MKILIDGPDQVLYQWDTGQRLCLEGIASGIRVDFGRCSGDNALSCYTYEDEGKTYADIPDAALQQPGQLMAYFVTEGEGCTKTVFAWSLVVLHRPKPDDYVEPEQIKTWHALEQRIDALEKGGGDLSVKAEIVDGVLVVSDPGGSITAKIMDGILICEMEE